MKEGLNEKMNGWWTEWLNEWFFLHRCLNHCMALPALVFQSTPNRVENQLQAVNERKESNKINKQVYKNM